MGVNEKSLHTQKVVECYDILQYYYVEYKLTLLISGYICSQQVLWIIDR